MQIILSSEEAYEADMIKLNIFLTLKLYFVRLNTVCDDS